MKKTLLIAGHDLPDGREFADSVAQNTRTAVITSAYSGHSGKSETAEGIVSFEWNRGSPVAAYSLVLQCENEFGRLDEAVLYFDEAYFLSTYRDFSVGSCPEILDSLIAGYQYLTLAFLARAEAGKIQDKPAKLVFLYKTDAHHDPHAPVNPLVKAAGAAFAAFALNTAVAESSRESVHIVLVHADTGNETVRKDSTLASWLCTYLDMLEEQKPRPAARQSAVWIKPGTKNANVFAFFH
jgi:hypothetical protein